MLTSHIVYHLTSSCRHKMVPKHRLEPHQLTFELPLAQALIGIVEGDMLMLLIFSSHPHFQLQALKGVPKAVKPYLLTLQCTLVERGIIRNSIGRQFQVINFWTSSHSQRKAEKGVPIVGLQIEPLRKSLVESSGLKVLFVEPN